ncbi:hypothetical protein M422DRAFT_247363 [Sphaerobolus stellatus SS14]|nr:hypothetical protein M422DRAFT_247363 [Sphaerobolus stellatus SS14]
MRLLQDDFLNLQKISRESETTAMALLASRYLLLCVIDTMTHIFTGNPYKAYKTILDELVDEHPYDIPMLFTKMNMLNVIVSVLEITVDRGSACINYQKLAVLHTYIRKPSGIRKLRINANRKLLFTSSVSSITV